MFTRVLIPFDPTSDAATPLPLAFQIALATKTTVMLICIVPRATVLDDPRCVTAEVDARKLLADLPTEASPRPEIVILPIPADADLASLVAAEIATQSHSLIVVTRHDAAGERSAEGDAIVEAILAESPDPLILVRPEAAPVLAAGLAGGIVVPLDGTIAGEVAIEPAVQLSRAFGGEIFLLRVVEPSMAPCDPAATRTPVLEPELEADHFAFADARYYIEEQVRRLRSRGLVVHGRAVFGTTSATILETAQRLDAGLIALSTHMITSDQRRFAENSVAATIAQQAPCPVVLMRRNEPHLSTARVTAVAERV